MGMAHLKKKNHYTVTCYKLR